MHIHFRFREAAVSLMALFIGVSFMSCGGDEDTPPPQPVQQVPQPAPPTPAEELPSVVSVETLIDFNAQSDLNAFDMNRFGVYEVTGGALRINTMNSSAMARIVLKDFTFRNGTVEVKTRHVSGEQRAAFGLEFRGASHANGLNNYRFDTNSNVSYHVGRTVEGAMTSLTEWGWIPRESRQEENTLKAVCDGNELTLYLNGIQVAQLTDDGLASGWVGLYVNPGLVVEFDQLRIESGS